jgi:hypothetical protein
MEEILVHCQEEARGWGPWFPQWFAQMFPQGQLQNWHALREQQELEFAASLDQRFIVERQAAARTQQSLYETVAALSKALIKRIEPPSGTTRRSPRQRYQPIRDLAALQRKGSLAHGEAAAELDYSDRTIRSMVAAGTLTQTQKKRIVVDSRFINAYNQRHSSSR